MTDKSLDQGGSEFKAGFIDGLKGLFMEPMYFFRVTKYCPACGSSWNGWYAKKHMAYCHHCGEELVANV